MTVYMIRNTVYKLYPLSKNVRVWRLVYISNMDPYSKSICDRLDLFHAIVAFRHLTYLRCKSCRAHSPKRVCIVRSDTLCTDPHSVPQDRRCRCRQYAQNLTRANLCLRGMASTIPSREKSTFQLHNLCTRPSRPCFCISRPCTRCTDRRRGSRRSTCLCKRYSKLCMFFHRYRQINNIDCYLDLLHTSNSLHW